MKIINLELIDTFNLSQEAVMDRPLSERKTYAFNQCVRQVMKDDYCDEITAIDIVQDSLTFLQVQYS